MGAGIWASHILLIPSGFGYSSLVIASMLLLLCSGTSWISGILTMQKSWRVVGALDLLISWVVALIIFSTRLAIDELLGVLITSSILLGIVTHLNQTYENELVYRLVIDFCKISHALETMSPICCGSLHFLTVQKQIFLLVCHCF